MTILQFGMWVVGNSVPGPEDRGLGWVLLPTCLDRFSPDAGETLSETMMGIVELGGARRGTLVTTSEP